MKVYPIDIITRDVKTALDFNKSGSGLALLGDTDTLSLNEIIKSKIIEAVKNIHAVAPAHLLDSGNNFSNNIYWKEGECGWIVLPEDFLRLVSFKMDDWDHAVYTASLPDSPEYKKQSSRFKGIRGTSQRPVCFITVRPEGKVLEFFSCKSDKAKLSQAVYIPYPIIDDNDGVSICERCYQAVIYNIASLVLTAIGEYEKSQTFNELTKTAL